MPDITLINLNMLFMRYGDQIERELHVPLGCLYLVRALEGAGFAVDFRDYQMCPSDAPFDMDVFLSFAAEPAPVIGLSCMANLLPFTILAMRALKQRYLDRVLVLGGVGSKAVEQKILARFPWVDVICRGEGEITAVELLAALLGREGRTDQRGTAAPGCAARKAPTEGCRATDGWASRLAGIAGISYRADGRVLHNPDRKRIADLDAVGFPAWEKVDLKRYAGYGMMTSRGCPYPCTFCSVAPVWDLQSFSRSPKNIVDEMAELNRRAGVDLFLFQDEFFVSGKRQVMDFCRELSGRGLKVRWKAFGRVNLIDEEMMRAMAECGCVELRFGVESGSDAILKRVRKGFTAAQTLEVIPKATAVFPRVDVFYIWGFPFETMDDFNQSLFQMVSFRMMGARILPSLLSLLPQTQVYRELIGSVKLEFCPHLLPEFVFTGHEISRGGEVEIPPRYREYFQLIQDNPDIFPGFFHVDLAGNVLPKLALLRQFGFYPESQGPSPAQLLVEQPAKDARGSSSPRAGPQELATRA